MKKWRILALAGALALAGCMGSGTGTSASGPQATEYACAAGTAALKTVTALNAKLTAANRVAVSRAVAVMTPVCSQQTVPTLDSTAQAALTAAVAQLTAAATQVSQP